MNHGLIGQLEIPLQLEHRPKVGGSSRLPDSQTLADGGSGSSSDPHIWAQYLADSDVYECLIIYYQYLSFIN
jgi:hypothetical protein